MEADTQYRLAAGKYLAAGGDVSQKAIAAKPKRDAARISGLLPGAVTWTRSDFAGQDKRIRRLRRPTPEVLALRDFVCLLVEYDTSCNLQRRSAQLLVERPVKMAKADFQLFGERGDIYPIEFSLLD